jgi:hypothetical protein
VPRSTAGTVNVSSELAAAATPSAADSQYAAPPGPITRLGADPVGTWTIRVIPVAIALTRSHQLTPKHVQAGSAADGRVGQMVPVARPDGPKWGRWARRPVTFGSGRPRCPLLSVTPGGGRDVRYPPFRLDMGGTDPGSTLSLDSMPEPCDIR